MKPIVIKLSFFLFLLNGITVFAQDDVVQYKRNAINTNVTLGITNEWNFGIERFFSPRRSIEINGGLVRPSELLANLTESWSNSQYFYESGYTVRLAYKMYRPKSEGSRWQDYIAPVLLYKYLEYEPQWFQVDNGKNNDTAIYQERQRSKFGFEFLWGKIYELNKTFDIELYYGVGVRATVSDRTDILKQDVYGVSEPYPVNFSDHKFYFRPSIHAGAKIRLKYGKSRSD